MGDLPVESVSWYDAIAFCNMLSRRYRLQEAYLLEESDGEPGEEGYHARVKLRGLGSAGFRLPTEAEWEYLARAGSPDQRYAPLDDIAWYRENSQGKTHPVGKKKPNTLGLFDMLGNVSEWCLDRLEHYPATPQIDPVGTLDG